MGIAVRLHHKLVDTPRLSILNFLEQHNRCKISFFIIFILSSVFLVFKLDTIDFKENGHMRPREGHRGHLKGRMMFLWSHLFDGTLHPLAFGTVSSSSHGFWVLFDEEDTSDSLFPRTY